LLHGAGVGFGIFGRREFVPADAAGADLRMRITESLEESGVYVFYLAFQITNDHAKRVCFDQTAETFGGACQF
jgi:hypothetical protein